MKDRFSKFATLAVHAGQNPDPETGAVMIPVYQTSTFRQESPGVFKDRYDYSRAANPTRTPLEANLAALERGKHGICFSSGLASIAAVVHLLDQGDHVILCDDVYGGTFRLFDKVFKKQGIEFSSVDLNDTARFESSFRTNTKIVWAESPTNPLLKIIDLKRTAEIAHSHRALLAVDNTFATPYLQNPLEFGADIVSHSTTKYIGGHSDLIGGVLIVNDDELAERLLFIQLAVGAVPAPWDCFLTLRSTKTLHIRMERHCQNAHCIAKHLEDHPQVEKVIYPGLKSHPNHELAARQMRDFGGIVTIVVKGGLDKAKSFLEKARVFTLAESLGGVESLLDHPAIMTHASLPPQIRRELGIEDGLIRLSVGIEDAEDLICDLDQALG